MLHEQRGRLRPCAAVLVLVVAVLASGLCCPAKEATIQALARGDDGRAGRDGLVALLATAMLVCGAADSDLLLAMGTVLYGRGDSEGALRCWRAGWRLSPLSVGLANNVAAALIDLSRPVDAISALHVLEHRLFLARQPATTADWWKTDINMASALAELDKLRGSAGRLQRALAHPALTDTNPQKPVAAANLIYTRRRLCDWKAFESDVQMGVQLIRRQLTGAFDFLLPGSLPVDPFMALTFLPPWPCRSDGDGSIGPEQVLAATYQYARGWHVPEAVHLTSRRSLGFSMAGGGARWSVGASKGAGRRGERAKLVVGYVCSEFGRRHSVMLLMRAVFEKHNRAAVRVLCFSTRPVSHSSADGPGSSSPEHDAPGGAGGLDGCEEALELGGGSDASQAAVINFKLPHVLVDLNGWTAGHAMGALAYRPSPLIVNYMGFAGSTGAEFVDFAAFDPVVAPPEHAGHFSERLILLPHSYFVTDFLRADFSAAGAPRSRGVSTLGARGAREYVLEEGRKMSANHQSGTRSTVAAQGGGGEEEEAQDILEAEGLERHAVRVCNHDQGYKLDPYRFASWCRVLQPCSGARDGWREGHGVHVSPQLWLLGQGAEVDGARSAAAPAAWRSRIVFARKTPVRAHMRRIRLCHLALDTSTIGAHTTSANYLWARVPVVTLPGQHVMSRVAASLLLALARDQRARSACASATIVRSEDEYVAVARALARGAGAAESTEWTRGDTTPRSSAVLDAYTRIWECLRAATEPLDARLGLQARKAEIQEEPRIQNEWRSDGGGPAVFAPVTGSSSTDNLQSRAALPAVFDTARWVRDWERALMLAVDLSVGLDTGLRAGAGAADAAGFSLVVCSRPL